MKNLSLNDQTQAVILPHLQETEHLLARAATKVSGRDRSAEITVMPDLGLPHNVRRILGGFFTGALYNWESDVPLVPVDATVNSCGVSMFKLNDDIASKDEFDRRVASAIRTSKDRSSYLWNFDSGNHFVIYGEVNGAKTLPDGKYALMHSSASEFKKQHNGLYPTESNWFADRVETIEDTQTGRYIRYIQGKTAERFIQLAQSLDVFNQIRHRYFAETIFGAKNIEQEIINEQHYGMPTANSVAIGCQWSRERMLPLLTAPEKPIFLVKPHEGDQNDVSIDGKNLLLYPHGLGKEASKPLEIAFRPDSLTLNGKTFGPDASIKDEKAFRLRNFEHAEADGENVPRIVSDILTVCPAEIVGKVRQLFSYHSKAPLSSTA